MCDVESADSGQGKRAEQPGGTPGEVTVTGRTASGSRPEEMLKTSRIRREHQRTLRKAVALIRNDPCPPIGAAIPPWPRDIQKKAVWFGLHRDRFVFTHHPSHDLLGGAKSPSPHAGIASYDATADNLFCVPRPQALRLRSILRQSRGGSVLVTGYRGTGKS